MSVLNKGSRDRFNRVSGFLIHSVLVTSLLVGGTLSGFSVFAETGDEISDRLEELEGKRDDVKDSLFAGERELSDQVRSLRELRDELRYVSEGIELIRERVELRKSDLDRNERELANLRVEKYALEGTLLEREAEFRDRLRVVYESSYVDYIGLVLGSDSLGDFVWRLGSYRSLLASDREYIDSYLGDMEELAVTSDRLEGLIEDVSSSLADLSDLDKELRDRESEMGELEDQLNREVSELTRLVESDRSRYEKVTEDLEIAKRELVAARERERLEKERIQREQEARDARLEAERKKSLSNISEAILSDPERSESSSEGSESGISVGDISVGDMKWDNKDIDKGTILLLVKEKARKYDIPYELVAGVIQHESAFDPTAYNLNKNGTIDRGLMQINSNTGPGLARQMGMKYEVGMEFVPEIAVEMGSYYLAQLYNPNNLHRTLSSYNRGPAGARAWEAEHGTFETEYSRKVMGYIEQFRGMN